MLANYKQITEQSERPSTSTGRRSST